TNILTDSDNCGGCASGLIAGAETSGEVCAADQVCQAGACVDEDIDVQDDDTGSDDNGGSSGGGGGSCFSDWSCGYWSACGIDSTQTRVCEDLRNCVRTDKIETQDCVACIESWVCTSWSSCVAGKQSRQCSDENMCGSSARKPIFQKDCGSPDIGYTPAGTTPSQGEPTEPSFWSQYWLWMLLALLVILIAGGIFLYFYFWKPKEGETNISELKTWVKGAMAKGATKKKIRETIKKHGEWSNKELRHVFRSLKKEAKAAVKAAKIKVPKLK
ncbi:hypothetical protein GOV03_01740, partial [Candidatus Woesearchaeota archaeon]|nr:hypothetical protein [Candidatus Woesearchaeota archaeon]